MNKMLVAVAVGAVGLGLGFGAGWLWDNVTGDAAGGTPSPAASSTAEAS